MKNVLLIFCLLLTSASFAATSTSTFGSLWTKLKASPFSLGYEVYADSKRVNGDVRGVQLLHYLPFSYSISPNMSVRVMPEVITEIRPDEHFTGENRPNTTSYSSTEFRFALNNILTEDDHGVRLNYQSRYSVNSNQNTVRGIWSNRLYFSNRLTEKVSLLNYLRWDHNHLKSEYTGAKTRRENRFRYYFSPSYAATDALSISPTLRADLALFEEEATDSTSTSLNFTPTISYAINSYQTVGFFMIYTLMKDNDGSTFVDFNDAEDEILYEVFWSVTLF